MSHGIERPADIQAPRHVGFGELEARPTGQMLDVLAPPSRQIVDADDSVAARSQSVAEVRPEEARTSGNQGSHISSCASRAIGPAAAGLWPAPMHLIVQPASRQRRRGSAFLASSTTGFRTTARSANA